MVGVIWATQDGAKTSQRSTHEHWKVLQLTHWLDFTIWERNVIYMYREEVGITKEYKKERRKGGKTQEFLFNSCI
jgi:hypothetical protein